MFLDGVDGRVIPIPREAHSPLKSPEAACALGHIQIYEGLLGTDQNWALVFEDDVSLAHDFYPVLNQINAELLPSLVNKPTVMLLGGQEGIRSHFYFVGLLCGFVGRHKILRSFHSEKYLFRTCGYLINREAAQRIASANQGLMYRADEWASFMNQGALEEIYLLQPGIVIHPKDLSASTIQAQRSTSQSIKTPIAWLNAKLKIISRLIRFVYLFVFAKLH